MKVPGVWSRLQLAPRIAIIIFVSLVSVKGVDELVQKIVPPPALLFLERAELIDAVHGAYLAASRNPDDQSRHLGNLSDAKDFELKVLPNPPRTSDVNLNRGFIALKASIAVALGLPESSVAMVAESTTGVSGAVKPLVIILERFPTRIVNVNSYKENDLISGDLQIAVKLASGDWLVLAPRGDGHELLRRIRNLLTPLGSIMIVGLLSFLVARGVVRPLKDLSAAAERLGRSRELSLVGTFKAPELQAIGNTFNDMQLRLKRFVDDRLQMIAAISHDLRTPLTRLRLFAEYVQDHDQRRQVLSDINDMEAMVAATLTFAGNELKNEPQSAADLASLLISLCDTAADGGRQVTYRGPDHAGLFCQPISVRRALSNLIDNGCKFADRVDVSLRMIGSDLVVVVEDDGPGIAPEDYDAAFQPFTRLEVSRNRETGGTGLGLTIARDVVVAHQGTIELGASEELGGLKVRVSLPKG